MSDFKVEIVWQHAPLVGHSDEYSRAHTWRLGGGQTLRASSAVDYAGDADRTNPEEALVAAVASCHMLTFLAVAAKRGFKVTSYRDRAGGTLAKNADGRMAITEVVLCPAVAFDGVAPGGEELEKLHESAHRNCFVANSIKAEVRIEAG